MSDQTPSTWPSEPQTLDLTRDGQSSPHPEFARHITVEVGPGAGKQSVRAYVRGGKSISPYFRGKQGMAPFTNDEPVELYKGKTS